MLIQTFQNTLLYVWKYRLNANRKTVKNQLSILKKKVQWKYVWSNKEHNYRWLWETKKCAPEANKPSIKDDLHAERPELARRIWLVIGRVIKNEVIKNPSEKWPLGSAMIGGEDKIRHKSSWWMHMSIKPMNRVGWISLAENAKCLKGFYRKKKIKKRSFLSNRLYYSF